MFEKIIENIKSDIDTVKRRDPAARSTLEILLTYSGLHAIIMYRAAHWFHTKRLYTVARCISQVRALSDHRSMAVS